MVKNHFYKDEYSINTIMLGYLHLLFWTFFVPTHLMCRYASDGYISHYLRKKHSSIVT